MQEPTIDGFRKTLRSGHAAVIGMLRREPDNAELLQGDQQYKRTLAVLNEMTELERQDPLQMIDADAIRRLSTAVGILDQEVIQILFSYRDFCEQHLRAQSGM